MAKEIVLTCVIRKERNIYSALCPELDVASQGSTPAEAKNNLKEAVELFLRSAKEEGMLEEVLAEQELKKKPQVLQLSVPLPA